MTSRRALLAAAPVVLLAGCGSNAPEEQTEDPNVDLGTEKEGDIALLNQLLEAGGVDEEAVTALRSAVRALGGRPAAAGAGEDPQQAYAMALDVIPKLADSRLRTLCAGILADCAAAVAQRRIRAGEDAVPEAFVT